MHLVTGVKGEMESSIWTQMKATLNLPPHPEFPWPGTHYVHWLFRRWPLIYLKTSFQGEGWKQLIFLMNFQKHLLL